MKTRTLEVAMVTLALGSALSSGIPATARAGSPDEPVGAPESAAPAKGSPEHIRTVTGRVDGYTMRWNELKTRDWPSYGLDYAETRHSKLRQITTSNVKNLGLVWTYNLESRRGVEATPVVVDGIMYVTASWSVVHALDTRTGKRLWTFDPKVPRTHGPKGCCDVVNRGVALWKGKVYVGTYDGRLVALDAATGAVVWEKDTIVDRTKPYTITGAPRVYRGKVIIGNGGSEYGVRGYITAYDAATGEQKWRWFTVPGDPAQPYENAAMKAAAKTWDPAGKYWINGGGGTVWDTMTFDPELNLMYIGTGNGSPWSQKRRSPAGGDNLYLASVVALNPENGEYVWHFQETPGDNGDYTSTQPIILADIRIRHHTRKVLLHAPKNGFFFVIDRVTGKLISAKNFVDVNWAIGYDERGRPIETTEARPDRPFDSVPGPIGAHNWQSMSYNPQTGLVYLPAHNVPINLMDDKEWQHGVPLLGRVGSGIGWNTGFIFGAEETRTQPFGRLIAWNPVTQREVWRHEHISPWNGGTLTTAGNLVFQGTADGRFMAFNATTGERLWESPTGTGVIAAPVTYQVDGKQYVSIAVGWGGTVGLASRSTEKSAQGTVFTYALGGDAPLPAFAQYRMEALLSGVPYDPADVEVGRGLYISNCLVCHGIPGVDRGGNIRNLAWSGQGIITGLERILFEGVYNNAGMPDFNGKLTADDVVKLKAFIQGTADAIRAGQEPAVPPAKSSDDPDVSATPPSPGD